MSPFSFKCSMIGIIRINLALSSYGNEASATYQGYPAGTVLEEMLFLTLPHWLWSLVKVVTMRPGPIPG